MSSLKQKIALFIAKRKYFSKKSASQNFKGKITNSSKILIILPDNAEDILKSLDVPSYFKNHQKEVTLLTEQKLQHVAQEEHKFVIITFDEESITRLGLPDKELSSKLSKLEFDAILDLNRNVNMFYSILANIPKSSVIVGFKKENADDFYNLQIVNNQNNAEISYRNFLNSIQMF